MKIEENNSRIKFVKEWIMPMIVAIAMAILINKFSIFQIQIPSESMVPTINIGDRFFATRVYNKEKLKRGELIVFYSDELGKLLIKRLIGLPNDEIIIKDGVVSINGEVLQEDYVKYEEEFNGQYTVPPGQYFFLGDNRANSGDSRYWKDTYIESKEIKGRAVIKIYPFDEIGFVEKNNNKYNESN